MKNYIEINLLEDTKINTFNLWQKLFTQTHLGLVAIQDTQKKSPIGISFPEYHMGEKFGILGSKLRLFAENEAILQQFDAKKQFSRLSDYIHITGIREVPAKLDGYAIYSRHQPKVNKERLARRYAKRHDINYEEALKHYEDMKDKKIQLPFIRLKSMSKSQEFCLWIKKTCKDKPNYQKFTTYGLSNFDSKGENHNDFSTVPEF